MLNHVRLLTTIVSAPMTTSGVLRCFCKGIKKEGISQKRQKQQNLLKLKVRKHEFAGLQVGLYTDLKTRHCFSFCIVYKIVIIYITIKVRKTGGLSRPFSGHDFAQICYWWTNAFSKELIAFSKVNLIFKMAYRIPLKEVPSVRKSGSTALKPSRIIFQAKFCWKNPKLSLATLCLSLSKENTYRPFWGTER